MVPFRSLVPILPVRSISQAVSYYLKLGFTAELYADGQDYAFLRRDTFELHLRHAPDLVEGRNPCGIYVYLPGGTAARLEEEFRAEGIPVLSALAYREWHMNEFMLSDPDGNLLRFGEPLSEPARAH